MTRDYIRAVGERLSLLGKSCFEETSRSKTSEWSLWCSLLPDERSSMPNAH